MTFDIRVVSDLEGIRESVAPLYVKYGREDSAQRACISMDDEGNVTVYVDQNIGPAAGFDVAFGKVLEWNIPGEVRGDALAEFLESSEVRALLLAVSLGHEVVWDGKKFHGSLDDDARNASDQLDMLIQCELSDKLADVYEDMNSWLFCGDAIPLSDVWGNGTIEELVQRVEMEMAEKNIVLGSYQLGIKEVVLDSALSTFCSDNPEKMLRIHVDALLQDDLITADEHLHWVEEYDSEASVPEEAGF